MESPVTLRVSNQKAYVWDVDVIEVLRTRHRVCGVLTGTLPHLAQQNLFLGVPLLLNPEEVVLLVTKGLAVLVDDAPAHRTPTLTHLQAYNATQAESARHQIAQVEAKEAAEAGRAQSDAATRKRKEREGKRKRDAALRDQASGENFMVGAALMETFNPKGGIEPSRKDSESRMGNDREGSGTPSIVHSESKHAYSIVIPASSSSLEWYDPTEYVYTTIAAAKDAGIWTYPTSLHERAKCGVFKDLWAQGFYMGGGIKFGGDFLVYPGDPLRYHSHFTASVIDSPISSFRPMEIVAHGRLGTATKKAHLLCGWDDEKAEVSYFSIEWAGFG